MWSERDSGYCMVTEAIYTPGSGTVTMAFAYDNANELTAQTVGGTSTAFGYDAWGRMTAKSQGDYSASYAWRYGGKLYSVACKGESGAGIRFVASHLMRIKAVPGGGEREQHEEE